MEYQSFEGRLVYTSSNLVSARKHLVFIEGVAHISHMSGLLTLVIALSIGLVLRICSAYILIITSSK
jgi:hypothetical protein